MSTIEKLKAVFTSFRNRFIADKIANQLVSQSKYPLDISEAITNFARRCTQKPETKKTISDFIVAVGENPEVLKSVIDLVANVKVLINNAEPIAKAAEKAIDEISESWDNESKVLEQDLSDAIEASCGEIFDFTKEMERAVFSKTKSN